MAVSWAKNLGLRCLSPLARTQMSHPANPAPAWKWGQTPQVERGPETLRSPSNPSPCHLFCCSRPCGCWVHGEPYWPLLCRAPTAQCQQGGPGPKGRAALPFKHLGALCLRTPTKLVTVSSSLLSTATWVVKRFLQRLLKQMASHPGLLLAAKCVMGIDSLNPLNTPMR